MPCNLCKKIINVTFKVFIIITVLILIGIIALCYVLCYNPKETLSASPFDNHNIQINAEGCMWGAMPGHGQRSYSYQFRNQNIILFKYNWDTDWQEGDYIFNVLWYRDSTCLYISTAFDLVKETIYYDTYSKKREIISGDTLKKEIIEYYSTKLKGKWISSIDTIEVNDKTITILGQGKKEVLKWKFPHSATDIIMYNDLSFFYPKDSYRRILSITDTELILLVWNFSKDKKNIVRYEKISNKVP